MKVVVIGAGAFGGWTALHLLGAGADVTLVDAWGPGHSRSSSGDDTRVIRGSYGPNAIYTEMVARSLSVWLDSERKWGVKLLYQSGALWMAGENDGYEKASAENVRAAGMPVEILDAAQGARRWPQMNWAGLRWAIYEPQGGFLMARRACQAVVQGFVAKGGKYLQAHVDPTQPQFEADQYVYACGPWLGKVFPDVLGGLITPTRQEAFYFGPEAGDARFNEEMYPAYVDNSGMRFYGIPGNEMRGFKVARDVAGPPFDPTHGDRRMTEEALATVRGFLAVRFPELRNAPLTESRVCQYEMSPDGGLIVDRHPEKSNVWFVGGGSGHSFKFGPALGDHVARLLFGMADVIPQFALSRFSEGSVGKVGERK